MITFASLRDTLVDGVTYREACRRLEEAGAAVVGLNCSRGPVSLLPLLKEVRQACKVNHPLSLILYWLKGWIHAAGGGSGGPQFVFLFFLFFFFFFLGGGGGGGGRWMGSISRL